MTSSHRDAAGPQMLGHVLCAAAESAERGTQLALTAGQVVARRVALGIAAVGNPLAADHVEFARIIPEKIQAFSAAGMIALDQTGEVNRRISRMATDDALTTVDDMIALAAGCAHPLSLATAPMRFAARWFDRVTTNALAAGMLVLHAQNAAMGPIQAAVADNGVRLAA